MATHRQEITTPQIISLPEAAPVYQLDDRALRRLRRLLRGREVLPNIFRHPRRYTVTDVHRAVAYDRLRSGPAQPAGDLVRCALCGRLWIDQAACERHVARDHHDEASRLLATESSYGNGTTKTHPDL